MTKAQLGLKENWQQFSLLVLVNAFVGGIVGLERSILPQLAEEQFHLAAKTAILSFIVVFGITKALTNYFAGTLANRCGRKNLLILGWIFALPVPFLLIYAPNWSWIIIANVFLGINQGLAWSSTVVMKIDLVGAKNRGFAMGINEAAGYLAVGAVAFLSAHIAHLYGIRPYPFYIGILLSIFGLLSSIFLIKDTRSFVQVESEESKAPLLKNIFAETSWKHPNLGAISQGGLVNNLNDGMIWGLFPILLLSKGFSATELAQIIAIYPTVWGLSQLFTGKLADRYAKKSLLFWGMCLQGLAILGFIWAQSFAAFAVLSVLLGLGTAVVYPTFLAAIADNTHPSQRAQSIGVYRLWRDLGYAVGALLTGILADLWSTNTAIFAIGVLTILSALVIQLRMRRVS
ncbi:MAG: MFS transporter [Crocinitomicaceae bacterium]|nr:MFS transporter [Crocinitomicaceae bacterium]MDP4723328.1 MFS transporter [Crocinitomicaceae bacterium]MDP4739614.1 MFS transporter [Crocinitomicaceae bacterium]MDP4799253.1 MFS transporter [Crocinitomicaceae bacterium]MDP4805535.1 MFS transporter [Crocinitomicaceae bacterium]